MLDKSLGPQMSFPKGCELLGSQLLSAQSLAVRELSVTFLQAAARLPFFLPEPIGGAALTV